MFEKTSYYQARVTSKGKQHHEEKVASKVALIYGFPAFPSAKKFQKFILRFFRQFWYPNGKLHILEIRFLFTQWLTRNVAFFPKIMIKIFKNSYPNL